MSAENQYLDLLRAALEQPIRHGRNGPVRSMFGCRMEFDMADGYPLLTTKKVAFRAMALELLWFLAGDANARWIEDQGVTIWRQWSRPYTENRAIVFVTPKVAEYVPYAGDYSTRGVGAGKGTIDHSLARTWGRMMRRCYDPLHPRYPFYGAKGVSVAKVWHDPVRFVQDAKTLPHWEYKLADPQAFDLDKDYFGANQYGPDTSVWLHELENAAYKGSVKPVFVYEPCGRATLYLSALEASRKTGMPSSNMSRLLRQGPPSSYKQGNRRFAGWLARYAELEGRLVRRALIEDRDMGTIYPYQWRSFAGYVDQIQTLLDGLRKDPYGRRHIVTAWNPAELDEAALPPCHILWQCYVEADERLSLQLYQRSGDLFLGVPFNIASYSLLLHMICAMVGRKPGRFIHVLGDAHLYGDHEEQARLQLTRTPRAFPKISVANRLTLDGWTLGDFTLTDYDPHPAISAPVSA